ncbi:MAG: hypothetical protein K8T10_05625 [Candidatus Eremiobacteraeota bacterium]|nr:hypothetical protein [Candidatus Eremiobacteraeota bacterium]
MKHRYRKNKGMNYIEIILVISLLMILVAFGAPSLEKGKRQASTKAAAMTFVEDLRAARQRAIDKQIPVAVVIPSKDINDVERAHAVGYYIVEGQNQPIITKSVNWKEKYPSSYVFMGFWDVENDITTTAQPKPHANDFRIDIQKWGGSLKDRRDYVFLFTPRGTVKTNGLPNFDKNFHIVVTRGIKYTWSTPSTADAMEIALKTGKIKEEGTQTAFENPTRFGEVDKAWMSSYTITVTPLGDVSMDTRLLKWTGTFETGDPPGNLMANAAIPPEVSEPPENTNPVIKEVEILPHLNPLNKEPTGVTVQGTCTVKSHNTLVVKAEDTDGDDLSVTFTCSKDGSTLTAPDSGWGFSSPETKNIPMQRRTLEENTASTDPPDWFVLEPNEDVNTHVLSADWTPPPDSISPHRYQIDILVEDNRGGKATDSIVIEILSREIIAFISIRDGGDYEIYRANSDGSDERRLTKSAKRDTGPDISPDGQKIVFTSQRDHDNWDIFVMNIDGTECKNLTKDGSHTIGRPHWSPNGTEIAYYSSEGGGNTIYIMDADGNNKVRVGSTSVNESSCKWRPVGEEALAFQSGNPDGQVTVVEIKRNSDGSIDEVATQNSRKILTDTSHATNGLPKNTMRWNRQGNKIFFINNSESNSDSEIAYINYTYGSTTKENVHELTNTQQVERSFCFSPDGTKILASAAYNNTPPTNIYLIELNSTGTGVKSYEKFLSDGNYGPSWSPF